MENTFTKDERLCGVKSFEYLIKNGKSKLTYPIKASWVVSPVEQSSPIQVAFAVPKKRFKRANKRNVLKRRLREAFRLNKHSLYQFLNDRNIHIHLLFVYVSNDILDYQRLQKATNELFEKIKADFGENC